uniref:Uncharacterized protein n=1 Tax=Gossypium raimondii TaxID=29730 RepID=A0A0D2U2D9_GOSRA|nr:hypothetical protein B456_009G399300 [Gossypium raimondii]
MGRPDSDPARLKIRAFLSRGSRKNVEGSLFVVKRNTKPQFQFIVMNRHNTDNLVENLLGDFEYEFHKFGDKILDKILHAYSKFLAKPKVFSSKGEFEELEVVPGISVIEGPLEPPQTASPATDAPEDSSFVNFFSVVMNIITNATNDDQFIDMFYHVLLKVHHA